MDDQRTTAGRGQVLADMRHSKLLILGNGPSLKGFDFFRTAAVDTLGMNAAYRYWDRIGWYPTHYCCVDDQLIETHHAEIFRLIDSGQVNSVFTLAKILDYQPQMANMDGVYFREQFHGGLVDQLKPLGSDKPHIQHPAFFVSNDKKLTTGAFAVRYGIFRGYGDIGLMGIDLEYVEILDQAENTEGLKLVIKEEVTDNPNYFFDDYQQVGDKYNIPNPTEHDGNLHVQAFEVLRDDIAIQGLDAGVVNLNTASRLHDLGIFPTENAPSFLGEAGVSAVAVPTTQFEIDDICQNIALWDMPAYHPVVRKGEYGKHDLVFIFSQTPDPSLVARIRTAWAEAKYLPSMFSGESPLILSADLEDAVDTYQREYVTAHGEAGYKSGPNLQFFSSMALLAERYRDFVFFMETDCAPVRAGWLTALDSRAKGDTESWVIGSHYRGRSKIAPGFFMHLNGNALYRVGDPGFQDFLREVWNPLLMDVIAAEDPRAAYDCVLSRHWSAADSHARNEEWQSYQAYASRFRSSSLILNISGAEDLERCENENIQSYLADHHETQVIHGRQFSRSLYGVIGAEWASPGTVRLTAIAKKGETRAPAFDRTKAPGYILMPEGKARKTGEDTFLLSGETGGDSRVMAIFDARIDPEDTYTVTLDVHANAPCTAMLALSRHGKGDYEGGGGPVKLKVGENTLSLTHTFHHAHARLRAQLAVSQGTTEVTVKGVDLSLNLSWWPKGLDFDALDAAAENAQGVEA